MAEFVHIPGMGNVDKRWIYGAGFLLGGGVIYAYWRSSKATEVAPTEGDIAAEDLAYAPDGYEGARLPGGATYDPSANTPAAATNADWSQRALDALEGAGYERNFVAGALAKYLSGQPLSASEALAVRAAWALLGKPPQTPDLPIITETTSGNTATTPSGNHKYVSELHKISAETAGRDLVRRFSDPIVSTGNNIQTALGRTTADPRNLKYAKYYFSHGGRYPAQAGVYVTVVKKIAA